MQAVLARFGPVWGNLTPAEQARLVQLLVAQVDYDGRAGNVGITFHPAGVKTLADELAVQQENQKQEKRA